MHVILRNLIFRKVKLLSLHEGLANLLALSEPCVLRWMVVKFLSKFDHWLSHELVTAVAYTWQSASASVLEFWLDLRHNTVPLRLVNRIERHTWLVHNFYNFRLEIVHRLVFEVLENWPWLGLSGCHALKKLVPFVLGEGADPIVVWIEQAVVLDVVKFERIDRTLGSNAFNLLELLQQLFKLLLDRLSRLCVFKDCVRFIHR